MGHFLFESEVALLRLDGFEDLLLRMDAHLAVNVADVRLHRLLRQSQLGADVGAIAPFRQQRKNFSLARRELVLSADELASHLEVAGQRLRIAGTDHAPSRLQVLPVGQKQREGEQHKHHDDRKAVGPLA